MELQYSDEEDWGLYDWIKTIRTIEKENLWNDEEAIFKILVLVTKKTFLRPIFRNNERGYFHLGDGV